MGTCHLRTECDSVRSRSGHHLWSRMGPTGQDESTDSSKQHRPIVVRSARTKRQSGQPAEHRQRQRHKRALRRNASGATPSRRQPTSSISTGHEISSRVDPPGTVGPHGPGHPSGSRLAPILQSREGSIPLTPDGPNHRSATGLGTPSATSALLLDPASGAASARSFRQPRPPLVAPPLAHRISAPRSECYRHRSGKIGSALRRHYLLGPDLPSAGESGRSV